jgi:hypothetical protein
VTASAGIHPSIQALLAAEPTFEETITSMLERPMRFIARRHRDEHVRKHVLAARNERWQDLVNPTLLSQVRDGDGGEVTFDGLARAYVRVLGSAFEEAVQAGVRVVRLVRFEILPPTESGQVIGGYRADLRTLTAWCPIRRLRIVAGFPVSESGVTAYRLLSGYRSDLRGSAGSFDRAVLRRLADRTGRSQERLLDPLPDADRLPAASGVHG